MNKNLTLKPNKEEKPTSYEVFYGETNKIGDFDMLEDGFLNETIKQVENLYQKDIE